MGVRLGGLTHVERKERGKEGRERGREGERDERREGEKEMRHSSWVWWNTPVIPERGRWRKENCKFQASLGYIVRP
jgi:hypothetical protein